MAEVGAPPGNKNASRENRLWSDSIRRACLAGDGKKLRAIADKLVEMAESGDIQAIKEIGDRLDGKAIATTEVSGPNGGPIETVERPQLTKEEWLAAHGITTA